MKVCSSPARLAVLNLALAAAFPAFAQSQLAPVVVTAARVVQPLTDVVADVSLIDREQIERSGATGLADLLVRLPGVEFARNGGPGTTTSLFLRGAASNHTAVFIDGMRIDTQSGSGGATWEAIPLAQIDRIVTGWRLRRVAEPIIANMQAQTPEAILAPKQVPDELLLQCRELGQAMGEGLALGVF